MKKLCLICADLNPNDLGGAEVHIVEVVKRFAEKFEIHLFVGNDDNSKKLFKSKNIFIHKVKYSKIKNLNSYFFVKAAVKTILNSKIIFDILWAKQVYPQAIVGRILKRKLRIPLYVTVQNPLAYKEELVLKGFFRFILSPFLFLIGLQVKRALRAANLCGCVSSYSQKMTKKMGAKKTVLIPNGIDLEKFKFYKGKREKFLISTTSTLIPRNGIDILVEAVGIVAKKYPQLKLRIAGEGPMEAELKKMIKALKIGSNVEFLGTLKHSEIPKLVNKSHLFIRPSRFEGFGVSFVEAMALGTPVITCPVGGIVDFIYDKETGLLIPPEDPKSLAKAIEFAFENPKKIERIVRNARGLVEERYGWEKITDGLNSKLSHIVS